MSLRASDISRQYGLTARHWIRLAAAGKVPGAWQPAGEKGAWLFDAEQFAQWRKAKKREAVTWQPSISEAKSSGRGPSVKVEIDGQASRRLTEQLLKSVLGSGSKNSTRLHGATSPGGRGKRHQKNSSTNTLRLLSPEQPSDTGPASST